MHPGSWTWKSFPEDLSQQNLFELAKQSDNWGIRWENVSLINIYLSVNLKRIVSLYELDFLLFHKLKKITQMSSMKESED